MHLLDHVMYNYLQKDDVNWMEVMPLIQQQQQQKGDFFIDFSCLSEKILLF